MNPSIFDLFFLLISLLALLILKHLYKVFKRIKNEFINEGFQNNGNDKKMENEITVITVIEYFISIIILSFCNEPLTDCILNGKNEKIFIADELNLTSEETMNFLNSVLEENFNCKIYIQIIKDRKRIKDNNMLSKFIKCIRKKRMSNILNNRIKIINYPNQQNYDKSKNYYKSICVKINNDLLKKSDKEPIDHETIEKSSEIILIFNRENKSLISNLNLRDLKKIFKRIYYQKENPYIFIGLTHYHNIYFYIMSQTNENNRQKVHNELILLLSNLFEDFDNLNKSNDSKKEINVEFIEENNNIYLSKGNCKINPSILTKFKKDDLIERQSTFLESLFLTQLVIDDEPLIFIGDTGYKTYLTKKLLNNNLITISLSPQIKINYLLGSTVFFNRKEIDEFYLKNLLNIINEDGKFDNYKKYINDSGIITDENIIKILKNNENINNKKKKIYENLQKN